MIATPTCCLISTLMKNCLKFLEIIKFQRKLLIAGMMECFSSLKKTSMKHYKRLLRKNTKIWKVHKQLLVNLLMKMVKSLIWLTSNRKVKFLSEKGLQRYSYIRQFTKFTNIWHIKKKCNFIVLMKIMLL
jgi:predicted transcriptional regulator